MNGAHAAFATGTATARRYAQGFSPIVAFADQARPDFAALLPYCAPGEQFYVSCWNDETAAGWKIVAEAKMYRMVWDALAPQTGDDADLVALGPEHIAQAMELAALTRPGPFGPRTMELGAYFGCFIDGRLAAMAGERATAAEFREISGVCTHPDFQGRGLARRLMNKLIAQGVRRGETPFLHVMCHNETAHNLYLKMGFR
ncbi:MAG: GNAT family N-acetyltransferase, partial [Burkholderiaceae bacterium]|nr:GNAT family N-acetyltransferase [Burkholderiaceae bacterium]